MFFFGGGEGGKEGGFENGGVLSNIGFGKKRKEEREERKGGGGKKMRTDLCRSSRLSFRHHRWMMVRVGELRARGLRLLRVRP